MMLFRKGVKIHFVIGLLVVFIAGSTALTNWYLSTKVLRDALATNHLNKNYHYAKKISISTSDLLQNMQKNISSLAKLIGTQQFTQADIEAWREANSGYYNSLFTVDENAIVQLMSPLVLENNSSMKPGTKIETDLMKQVLHTQQPFISDPYMAQSGNLVLLISSPIFDAYGNYKGVVDGTIYLESDNSLERILIQHEFQDESSVFVVNQSGKIIYHPDKSRINESIADHPLVQEVIKGKDGAAKITNNRGEEYFSGYAYVEATGWGIITQTPTSIIDAPLHNLRLKVILQSLPLIMLIILFAWAISSSITKPLNTLAQFSEEATKSKQSKPLHLTYMKSNIYEVKQLYEHIVNHLQLLNHQILQDGLTGIANRKAFDHDIETFVKQKVPFSLLMIDIDRFKRVNDEYGHLIGDDVIRFLANMMQQITRTEDLCYRYGGEEFTILLKDKNENEAESLAERLRLAIANTPSPTGKPITISIGISMYKGNEEHPKNIIDRADCALYHSKNMGRNRTTIYCTNLKSS